MRPQPFTTLSVVFSLTFAYLFLAQPLGLPYWRPDISTGFGLIEYLALGITEISLVSLAKRERRQRQPLSSIVRDEVICKLGL